MPHPTVEQLYVQQHKREERERGKGGKEGGKEGEMWVGGYKSRHIIVTHQPKGSNKERHAVLSPVQCWPLASSPRTEKDGEINGSIPTHTRIEERKKVHTVPQRQQNKTLFTKKPRDKRVEKEKKQKCVVCCWCVCGGSSIECALLLSLSLPYTHARPPLSLSLTHTHIGEPVQLPCSASSAAAARRNE